MSILKMSTAQVSITNINSVYSQDFSTLASTDTSSRVPTGWMFVETGNNANNTYAADSGVVLSGNTYSYGNAGSGERAFGTLLSGSLTSTIGVAFTNNTSTTINSFTITYTGEQWRLGTVNRIDKFDFQYSLSASGISSGSYIDLDSLDFIAPVTTGTVGARNGNDPINRTVRTATISNLSIAPGSTFYLRWLDFNATSNDDGLAVDDFSISFNGSTLPPCAEPTAQPTNLVFNSSTTSSIAANFTAASPSADQYLTVISTSSTLSSKPQNGTTYSDGDAIGNGSVVGVSSATSFSASSLSSGTTYYFYVFSVNSNCAGGPLYNAASPLRGNATTATPPQCVAPTGMAGSINFNAAATSISGSFASASGADGYLIVRSTSANFSFTPNNGTSYSVNQTVGTSNNGVVIKFGDGTTFSTSGLTVNTTYYFFVYSLSNSQCTGGPLYNTTATTGNATTTAGGSGVPPNYYSTTSSKSCADLKTTLKTIVTNSHTPKTYGELWGQYEVSDIKPREVGPGTSPTVIWDVYSDNPTGTDPYNFTPGPIASGGQQDNGTNTSTEGQFYNREHSVPLSWFGGSTGTPGAATDYHHIFPTDKVVNATRSNFIYGEVANASFISANGSKLGPSAMAGFTGDVFEPINEYKGDLARAFLYFVTRYQDNMPGYPRANGVQAFDTTTYPSVNTPYLQLMLKWHNQDPVSQKETDRNNAAYSFQGNRNPFVDSPQYVARVWNGGCPGLSALPVSIIYFGGKLVGGKIQLEWTVANELNLSSYEVERSFNSSSFTNIGFVAAKGAQRYTFSDYADALRGRRVFYRLKKLDRDGKYQYSQIFSIHLPLNTKFTVSPNPAANFIQLHFSSAVNGRLNVQLLDIWGKTVLQQNVSANNSNVSINTQSIASGTYIVKVIYNGEQYLQKVIITH